MPLSIKHDFCAFKARAQYFGLVLKEARLSHLGLVLKESAFVTLAFLQKKGGGMISR